MKLHKAYLILVLSTILLQSCSDFGADKPPPLITAQGFEIEATQEGVVSEFTNLRLRIESEGHIQQLHVKERSFEVDLATTPEREHFPLFGIENSALQHTDITLDFQNYINQKLTVEGEYQFSISVEDKKGQTANTVLKVRLKSPGNLMPPVEVSKAPVDIPKTPIETDEFMMQREGRGNIYSSKPFGITWKTIDEINVTIRVSKAEGGASKLASFTSADYDRLDVREELSEWINVATDLKQIEFDSSKNAAHDQVLGISNLGNYYLLRILKSNSSLSDSGTKVTLNGEYKF
jgi:hypothetical protein